MSPYSRGHFEMRLTSFWFSVKGILKIFFMICCATAETRYELTGEDMVSWKLPSFHNLWNIETQQEKEILKKKYKHWLIMKLLFVEKVVLYDISKLVYPAEKWKVVVKITDNLFKLLHNFWIFFEEQAGYNGLLF